jgi:hypothetical protein
MTYRVIAKNTITGERLVSSEVLGYEMNRTHESYVLASVAAGALAQADKNYGLSNVVYDVEQVDDGIETIARREAAAARQRHENT